MDGFVAREYTAEAFTWKRDEVVEIIEQEVYLADRLAPGAEIRKAVAAAIAADGRETFDSRDIERIAKSVLDRPITFGTATRTAKTDAPAAPTRTIVTKEPTPTGYRLTIRSLA